MNHLRILRCGKCGRAVSYLVLGCCESCIVAEMQRAKYEALDGVRGGQGRTERDITDAGEFIAWALLAFTVTLAVWGIVCAIKGGG